MMRVAVQMDPPHRLQPQSDSTIVLLREAARRGYHLYHYAAESLSWEAGRVFAPLSRLTIKPPEAGCWYQTEAPIRTALDSMDALLIRQDPPFDMGYITATYLLERLPDSVQVVNAPAALRSHAEKLLPLDYPEAMAPTLISPHKEELLGFLERHGDIVIKPLYGWGGHAVFRLRRGGDNIAALLELLGTRDPLPVLAQPFLPDVARADIRVITLHGRVAGAFARQPASGEIRANMRVGGVAVACTLDAKQQALCERIAGDLQTRGLALAGIDLIGPYLTEINVTSPTGLKALETLYGQTPATSFWDGLENRSGMNHPS